jgi:hypothetical protein
MALEWTVKSQRTTKLKTAKLKTAKLTDNNVYDPSTESAQVICHITLENKSACSRNYANGCKRRRGMKKAGSENERIGRGVVQREA